MCTASHVLLPGTPSLGPLVLFNGIYYRDMRPSSRPFLFARRQEEEKGRWGPDNSVSSVADENDRKSRR